MADPVKGPAQGPAPNRAAKVLVHVRTYAGQVPCAGRVFGPDEVDFEASPADVRDLLAASDRLIIAWPDTYVLPNGLKPSTGKIVEKAPATLTSADRVAIAEEQARVANIRAINAENAIARIRSDHGEEVTLLRQEVQSLRERSSAVTSAVSDAETRASADATALKQREEEHAATVDALKAQHKAELDSAKAEFASAIEASQAEQERLQAEVDRLTTALDSATAPKPKRQPTPAPAPANG